MSFYTSLSGLKNAQTSLGVIAHNISNSETAGFKKSRTEFADIAAGGSNSDPRKMMGIGSAVESITQNFSLGPVEQTGGALDVAITGDGFFTTQSADSGRTMYTRNGKFDIDEAGYIHDGANNRLQVFPVDATGTPTSTTPVSAQIPAVNGGGAEYAGITIGKDGLIRASYSDGSVQAIGSVALASFVAPTGLRQEGSSNWSSTGISGAARYGSPGEGQFGSLQAGAIERSNVDIAEELVGLITAQRAFQANAKAIDTATQIGQTVINLRS
jgi:flagellar hook protein FlgE